MSTKKTDHAKYDRQLRLWGEEGQGCLEDAHVCLINATATGCETLKNLILPGVGHFTIVDGHKVEARDFNNFFMVEGSIGKSRAQVAKDTLNELNDLVTGEFLERDPAQVIDTQPDYFKQFTVVIVNDLPEESLLKLAKICWSNNIVLVVVRVSGFIGYLRVAVPEHNIIESKPDNPADDLRLATPFEALANYADSIDVSNMNSTEHSHTPYIILLLKEMKKWKAAHGGKIPENYAEKTVFRKGILESKHKTDELNYDEAYKAYFKIFPTKIPSNTESVLRENQAAKITSESSKFWILAAAVRDFVDNEGAGALPLPGSIPDMHSTTNGYIALQRIYQEKAMADVDAVMKRVQMHLKSAGKAEDFITLDDVRKFCKNIQFVQSIRYRSLDDERTSVKGSEIASQLKDSQSNMPWYIVIRAADRFETLHKRYPGSGAADVNKDVADLKEITHKLLTELNVTEPFDDKYVQELVRYGDSELHTMASFFGGVTSQEVIKMITRQYVPLDNTFIYNGINSTSSAFSL